MSPGEQTSAPDRVPVMQRKGRAVLRLGPWLAIGYAATGLYTIRPNERGVVRRCGEVQPLLRPPGLHVGLPWGIDRVTRVKPRQSTREGVRMDLAERSLGRQSDPLLAECLTGDRNLISVPAIVQYRIDDPKAYLFNVADVPRLVRDATAAALSSIVAGMLVDDVLTTHRLAIQNEVRLRVQRELLDRYGAGVQMLSVSLEGTGPPAEVADAFRDVTRARGDAERAKNEARGYANRVLPEARGQAERIIMEAEAYRDELVELARGDTDRFRQIAGTIGQHRDLSERRLVLETMEQVLPGLRKIILDAGSESTPLDLGLIQPGK